MLYRNFFVNQYSNILQTAAQCLNAVLLNRGNDQYSLRGVFSLLIHCFQFQHGGTGTILFKPFQIFANVGRPGYFFNGSLLKVYSVQVGQACLVGQQQIALIIKHQQPLIVDIFQRGRLGKNIQLDGGCLWPAQLRKYKLIHGSTRLAFCAVVGQTIALFYPVGFDIFAKIPGKWYKPLIFG